jgi:SHS2 domain-containing protein
MAGETRAEQFPHGADIGIRGVGPTMASAFEQAAKALASCIAADGAIAETSAVDIDCEAPSPELLLFDWLNRLIYEMALRRLIFGRFAVRIEGNRLSGRAWGEPIDALRHAPAVEPKGATLTALEVTRRQDGAWVAQCVVDV